MLATQSLASVLYRAGRMGAPRLNKRVPTYWSLYHVHGGHVMKKNPRKDYVKGSA